MVARSWLNRRKWRLEATASKIASHVTQQVLMRTINQSATNTLGDRSGEILSPTNIVGATNANSELACIRRRNCPARNARSE